MKFTKLALPVLAFVSSAAFGQTQSVDAVPAVKNDPFAKHLTAVNKAKIIDLMMDVEKPDTTAAMPSTTRAAPTDIDLNDPRYGGKVSIAQIEANEKQHPGSHVTFDFNNQHMAVADSFLLRLNHKFHDGAQRLAPGIATDMEVVLSDENNIFNDDPTAQFARLRTNTGALALNSKNNLLDDTDHEIGHIGVKIYMEQHHIAAPNLALPAHGKEDIIYADAAERQKAAWIEFKADQFAMALGSPEKVKSAILRTAVPNPTDRTANSLLNIAGAFQLDKDHPGAGLRYIQAQEFSENKELYKMNLNNVMTLPTPSLPTAKKSP